MGLFSKIKSKDSSGRATPRAKKGAPSTNGSVAAPPSRPHWDDAWTRKTVEPEEVQELLNICTHEMKSRALDLPFLLLPFRPASDPSATRTFIRNYFSAERGPQLIGERLQQEVLLTEPMVLSSIMKWCWSRLSGGIVGWEAYELFRIGESDSNLARDAFATFIPISVESDARTKIVFDFFDLLAAIAAHGKANGMGGRKLSRFAGWWAFDHLDRKDGFDGGYQSWTKAADATSHLFFAYLRSLSPDSGRGMGGIATLPGSLQVLLDETRYPLEMGPLLSTSRIVMIVDSVSPTPFALLRRANHFEYRDEDHVLQAFSNFEDPVQALSDECRRVLKSIASANENSASTSNQSTSLGDPSWSRFEDIGFGAFGEDDEQSESALGSKRKRHGLHSAPQTQTNDRGRPTTPSWADFLSSGFVDENTPAATRPLILPPDKILPPINIDRRNKSSHAQRPQTDAELEPGELASIHAFNLDDAFWWTWMTSLAGEETTERKACFGRCALVETQIGGAWLVIEEMVKGAAPEPDMGAYIAEKKGRFTFGRKKNMTRSKSTVKKVNNSGLEPYPRESQVSPASGTSIGRDQHARIQAAAAALQEKQKMQEASTTTRRGRALDDTPPTKTNSVFTLQPVIMSEAAPAMKWASSYDKKITRAAYLGDDFAGTGSRADRAGLGTDTNGSMTPIAPAPIAKDSPRADHTYTNGQTTSNGALPVEATHEGGDLSNLSMATGSGPDTARQAAAAAATNSPGPAKITDSTDVMEVPQNGVPINTSPESKRNRLKKKEGRNFKDMFKKKAAVPPSDASGNPLAAAAARAALAPRSQNQSTHSLARRFSRVGRKDAAAPTMPPPPLPASENRSKTAVTAPYGSQVTDSQVFEDHDDQLEERTAENEFPRFDSSQGPMDEPAFVSHDDLDRAYEDHDSNAAHVAPPDLHSQLRDPVQSESFYGSTQTHHGVPPMTTSTDTESRRSQYSTNSDHVVHQGPQEHLSNPSGPSPMHAQPANAAYRTHAAAMLDPRGTSAPQDSTVSPASTQEPQIREEEPEPPMAVNDRWAQIRKNAAERAARSAEDTDGAPMPQRRDDGVDSTEETIESRVARIKARVAELTGNMPPEQTAQT